MTHRECWRQWSGAEGLTSSRIIEMARWLPTAHYLRATSANQWGASDQGSRLVGEVFAGRGCVVGGGQGGLAGVGFPDQGPWTGRTPGDRPYPNVSVAGWACQMSSCRA